MLLLPVELADLTDLGRLPVDAHADEPSPLDPPEHVLVLALLAAHDRRDDLDTRAVVVTEDDVGHDCRRSSCEISRPQRWQCGTPIRAKRSLR